MIPWHEGELLQWHIASLCHYWHTPNKNEKPKRFVTITMVREKWNREKLALTHVGIDGPIFWKELLARAEGMSHLFKEGGSRK